MAFGFLALIVINTYVANLAAVLTVNAINSQVRTIDDLIGKAVVTDAIYQARLRQHYGLVTLRWNDSSDGTEYMDDIVSGKLAAFIQDAPYLEYLLNNRPGCQLRTLPEQIEPLQYGLVFRSSLNDTLIDKFTQLILYLQENGDLMKLEQGFFRDDIDDCGNVVEQDTGQIGFKSMWGLWVIVGGVSLLGAVVMLLVRWKKFRQVRENPKDVV